MIGGEAGACSFLMMKKSLPVLIGFLAVCGSIYGAETVYPLTEDSKPHNGVPKGEVLKFSFNQSKIFPGTTRDYWVYIPAQYDPAKAACVFVCQDGIQYNAPVVFDQLIEKKEMPVTIGVFIMHGKVPALSDRAIPRFNRSLEYDGLGPDYARFVLEELLPEVEKKNATNGRKIVLSHEANDRAIGGASSGAICAFTAAWERPDGFSRVFSNVGTYVGLRGGNEYPTLIRKFEPKPIRVFLQDGSNDLNIYAGDWWMVNQEMDRALTFAGYEHEKIWGEGGHNSQHATAIFPEGMRFLWKGWPEGVKAGKSKNKMLGEILIPGEDWQLVWEGGKFTEGPCANAAGEIFFNDIPNSKTYRVALDGKVSEFLGDSQRANGQAFGADGRMLAVTGTGKVMAYDEKGAGSLIAEGIQGNDLVALENRTIYVTEPSGEAGKGGNLWMISAKGEKKIVDTGLKFPNGVTASPDQSLLYVAESRSHWVFSYQIQADGTLAFKQRYYWLHVPDWAEDAGADGLRVDREGRLYVATRFGVQMCDQAGRVNVILPTPNGRVSNLAFGGAEFETLYATCGDKVYKRKLKVKGANAFASPIKPNPPGL